MRRGRAKSVESGEVHKHWQEKNKSGTMNRHAYRDGRRDRAQPAEGQHAALIYEITA